MIKDRILVVDVFWQTCEADTFLGSQLEDGQFHVKKRMPSTDVDKVLTRVNFFLAFWRFNVAFRTHVEKP